MFGKIARSFAVVAVAAAPFVMSMPAAQAAAGCSVSNTSTTFTLNGQVQIPAGGVPTASVHWSNLSCSYTSGGGIADYGCTINGRCQIYRNGVLIEQCIVPNGGCSGTFETSAGDTVTVTVEGGSAWAQDRV